MTTVNLTIAGTLNTQSVVTPSATLSLTGQGSTVTISSAGTTGIAHTNLTSIGTNTHVAIDTHIADQTIHFTSPLTTKGDIWCSTGAASARLPVGTDGNVLLADSTQTTGLKWGPGAAIDQFISTTTFTASNASWPVPVGTTKMFVTICGGGGGGGCAGGGNSGNGGGSASGVVRMPVTNIQASTMAIVIGAGGVASTRPSGTSIQGAQGGNSTIAFTGFPVLATGFGGGTPLDQSGSSGAGGGSGGAANVAVGGVSGSQGGIAGPAGAAFEVAGTSSTIKGYWVSGASGGGAALGKPGGNMIFGFAGGLGSGLAISNGPGGAGGLMGKGGDAVAGGNGNSALPGSGAGGAGGDSGFLSGNGGSGSCIIECWKN